MASILIKLDKRRKNAENRYPVKILIFNKQTNASISLGLSLPASAWIKDGVQRPIKTTYSNAKLLNDQIEKNYFHIKKKIFELEESGRINLMKASHIKSYILAHRLTDEENITFYTFAKIYIESCKAEKTKQGYSYTIDKLKSFTNQELLFEDITANFLHQFEDHLTRTGSGINSRAIHFRYIRSLFNKAIADGHVSKDLYPFNAFKIKSVIVENQFLTPEQFRLLYNYEFKTETLTMARDYWLLMFFMCGISPIDLFYLKKTTDKDGRSNFARIKVSYKTQNPVRITIQPEAQCVFDKYKSGKESEFLLLFHDKYSSYEVFKSFASKKIREIAKITGLTGLSMYWARHTWATTADSLDINEKTISKALGHTDKSVAGKNYIAFDWSKVDAANRKVIDYILNL